MNFLGSTSTWLFKVSTWQKTFVLEIHWRKNVLCFATPCRSTFSSTDRPKKPDAPSAWTRRLRLPPEKKAVMQNINEKWSVMSCRRFEQSMIAGSDCARGEGRPRIFSRTRWPDGNHWRCFDILFILERVCEETHAILQCNSRGLT